LTAEAEDVLEEIEVGVVYVIGALVDRNRLPGVCHERTGQTVSLYSGFTWHEGYRWGLNDGTMGSEGKTVWQVDQTERSIYGSTTNPLHNFINHAIIMAPLIPYILTEDCKKAAMDRQIAVSAQCKHNLRINKYQFRCDLTIKLYRDSVMIQF